MHRDKRALSRRRASTPARRSYRVEFRSRSTVYDLGIATDGPAHHATLQPYWSRLRRDQPNAVGQLVLIDATSGVVLARRHIP